MFYWGEYMLNSNKKGRKGERSRTKPTNTKINLEFENKNVREKK